MGKTRCMLIEIAAQLQKKGGKKGGFQVFVDPVFHRGNVIPNCLQAESCQEIPRLFENTNKQTAVACYANRTGK